MAHGRKITQGTFCLRKTCTKREASQGSLEYIIIIGGIIILAAASYFMLRGFSQSSGAGAKESIETAGEKIPTRSVFLFKSP